MPLAQADATPTAGTPNILFIQSDHYALCGEGLAIGYDSGDTVSGDYTSRFEFSGGRIIQVVYDVADGVYLDQERQMAAALARD